MARPIEYDPEIVLLKAMNLFWEKGYEATSIKDIVAVTGLKPGSLYNLYGNKEGVFDAVVELYSEHMLSQAKTILQGSDNALTNINNFLNEMILTTICNVKTKGCLLAKTLLVLPPKDEKLQAKIADVFKKIELLLQETIKKAVDDKQTNVNPQYFSKFIITTIYGMHAYHKTDNNTDLLKQDIKFIMNILEKV